MYALPREAQSGAGRARNSTDRSEEHNEFGLYRSDEKCQDRALIFQFFVSALCYSRDASRSRPRGARAEQFERVLTNARHLTASAEHFGWKGGSVPNWWDVNSAGEEKASADA